MKKMILCLVAVVAMALGFTSCSEETGVVEIQYGFVDDQTGGITHGLLNAYAVSSDDLYSAFEVAFKSESGYEPDGVGACKLLNKDKLGHRTLVAALAVKGATNIPADFKLPDEQNERTFRVIYRFVGNSTTSWETAWEHTFKK